MCSKKRLLLKFFDIIGEVRDILGEKDFAELIRARQYKELSNLIAITGQFRIGKTTFALEVADKITRILGRKFDLKNQITMFPEEFEKLINENEEYTPLIFDDAHIFFSTSEYWNKFNRSLKRAIAFSTNKYQPLFFTLPNLERLYPEVRDTVNFQVIIRKKGKAEIYSRWERGRHLIFEQEFPRYWNYKGYVKLKEEIGEKARGRGIPVKEKEKTQKELAEECGVTPKTIRRWKKEGILNKKLKERGINI
jgi:hypothetical protein